MNRGTVILTLIKKDLLYVTVKCYFYNSSVVERLFRKMARCRYAHVCYTFDSFIGASDSLSIKASPDLRE